MVLYVLFVRNLNICRGDQFNFRHWPLDHVSRSFGCWVLGLLMLCTKLTHNCMPPIEGIHSLSMLLHQEFILNCIYFYLDR